MLSRQGQAASMGALDRQEAIPKKNYPGHSKLMQDMKGTQLKLEVVEYYI